MFTITTGKNNLTTVLILQWESQNYRNLYQIPGLLYFTPGTSSKGIKCQSQYISYITTPKTTKNFTGKFQREAFLSPAAALFQRQIQ
jgi:hypothetical protein